jgi:hypothetical protein
MNKSNTYIYYSPEFNEIYLTSEKIVTKNKWLYFMSPYGITEVTKIGEFTEDFKESNERETELNPLDMTNNGWLFSFPVE